MSYGDYDVNTNWWHQPIGPTQPSGPCPSCGHCRHCGRGPQQPLFVPWVTYTNNTGVSYSDPNVSNDETS